MTIHYLNPVVPENFTNKGTTGHFSVRYQRESARNDRVVASVRHGLSRFEVPNERVQQEAGQLQSGSNFETMGTLSYQHIFSAATTLGNMAGMVRDKANDLFSNAESTPIRVFQDNHFREVYFKGTVAIHRDNQEWKAGVESDAVFLHETFSYNITDPSRFDGGTLRTLSFTASKPDLEQSAFAEDIARLRNWTIRVGFRWDHYQLLLNRNAFSPRLAAGYYMPAATMVFHVSYDRVFQTPSNGNILLSSSPRSGFVRLDASF